MKKLTSFLLFAAVAVIAFAQTPFQGTINYSWKFMGEGVEQFEAMMPTGSILKVRGADTRFSMQGGMMAAMMGDIVSQGKKGVSYMIKTDESTAYKMGKKDDDKEEEASEPVVVKEDEVIQIAGFDCQKYSVTSTSQGMEITQYVWATEKYTMPEGNGGGMMGGGKVEGIKGLPLKVMVNQGPMTIVMTATSVDLTVPAKTEFKVPKGYKVEDFDPNMFGGMGM